jgi:hypothetical protein
VLHVDPSLPRLIIVFTAGVVVVTGAALFVRLVRPEQDGATHPAPTTLYPALQTQSVLAELGVELAGHIVVAQPFVGSEYTYPEFGAAHAVQVFVAVLRTVRPVQDFTASQVPAEFLKNPELQLHAAAPTASVVATLELAGHVPISQPAELI